MVPLSTIHASNATIRSRFPSGLVAVFVGATSGVGETTLKAFAKHIISPRVYFIGRSAEAGARIKVECEALNPEGVFVFLQKDVSLLKNVDDVCRKILARENEINVLCLSQGTFMMGTETTECLHHWPALVYYTRLRFMLNLLPLMRPPSSLSASESSQRLYRILTIQSAGLETPIPPSTSPSHPHGYDFGGHGRTDIAYRRYVSSMITLTLSMLAEKHPHVSFVHAYPGWVPSGVTREANVGFAWVASVLFMLDRWLGGGVLCTLVEEAGERLLYATTGRAFGAREGQGPVDTNEDVDVHEVEMAVGLDGRRGSGVYSVNGKQESTGDKVIKVIHDLKQEGVDKKLWQHVEDVFVSVTGSTSLSCD